MTFVPRFFSVLFGFRFLNVFLNAKKNEKMRKRGVRPTSTERCGGLAVAGGEVRRGKPSGTVRKNAGRLEPRQHPVGVRRIQSAAHKPPRAGEVRPARCRQSGFGK